MKLINYILGVCIFTLLSMTGSAQVDPHFSQYYNYPHFINPATTGNMEGDYRVTAIYRSQWANITTPFSTAGLTADMRTSRKMNFGGNILRETAGNGGYQLINGYASLAYTGLRFGNEGNQHVVLGMQAGFISKRIDPTKFQMEDQWNEVTGYSEAHPTNETFTNTTSMVFDMGAGALYYDATREKTSNIYFGVAAFHINSPSDPFLSKVGSEIPMRFVVHGGINVQLSPALIMVPNFLYMKQGTSDEKMLGGYFQVTANEMTDFMFGGNYRFKDAVSPFAGITHNNLTLGVTYDVNTSRLGKLVGGTGSVEFTLSYLFKNPEEIDYVKCPRF
jgi:type IX secretion system PorP/SprF family membrane protein